MRRTVRSLSSTSPISTDLHMIESAVGCQLFTYDSTVVPQLISSLCGNLSSIVTLYQLHKLVHLVSRKIIWEASGIGKLGDQ